MRRSSSPLPPDPAIRASSPSLHLRIRHRRPPGQGRRPDLRRRRRRAAREGSRVARRVRDDGHHRPGHDLRRDHDRGVRAPPRARARDDRAHRLHRGGLRLRREHVRGDVHHRPAVEGHRDGRGHRRRRRPGDDVRLRVRRDGGAHAAADHARAPAHARARRPPQGRHAAVAAPRRQVAGLRGLRERAAGGGRHGRDLDAAQRHREQQDDHRSREARDHRRRRSRGSCARSP